MAGSPHSARLLASETCTGLLALRPKGWALLLLPLTLYFHPSQVVDSQMCGDWPRSDIYARWPLAIAHELASFTWPITSLEELLRLLECEHASPSDVCGGEFTAAIRSENERVHGVVTLSVDLRASLVPGVHACLDMRLVLSRKRWLRAYLFPPCTHQTLSDTTCRELKEQDGRMFWGILFVIWCYCTLACMLLVEQPDTHVPNFFLQPTQRLHTSELGCQDDKTICLYERGRARLQRTHTVGGASGHGHLGDFRDADSRDRWRSSWQRFPQLVAAVVAAPPAADSSTSDTPSFIQLRERFAVAWHQAGLPVPHDYEADDAQPTTAADREYQQVRGRGDGRAVVSVVPRSLREALVTAPPIASHLSSDEERAIDLRSVTRATVLLCFVTSQTVPLVFAALNGFSFLGADFVLPVARAPALAIATRWAENAISAASSTFLVGEYKGAARLFTSPIDYNPPVADTVRTPSQRRARVKAGAIFAWCTLAALAGCIAHDPASRAVAACSALRGPVSALADSALLGHARLASFSVGMLSAVPIVDVPDGLPVTSSPLESALREDWYFARLLKDKLFDLGTEDPDLGFWADTIRPPQLQDVPSSMLNNLPTYDDARLDALEFVPDHVPPRLPRLKIKPAQPPLPPGICARSIFDLMPDRPARRIRSWLHLTLTDLICMRDHGADCERNPPGTLVVARAELYPWAQHHIFDFRRSPQECAVPLDYHAQLRPTLQSAFFLRELADYPNQRLVGMIDTGVIYMADVELHSVFVRHLVSLPKGFKAVGKELRRLKGKGWYDFFSHIPFWPIYFNAQGSTSRKLEPDRDRRTTEGGAPRRDTWDRDGVKVISINEASRTYHMPLHYLSDTRPEFLQWLRSRGLPPSPEQLASVVGSGTKWGDQHMPTLRTFMQNLAVLKRASRRLGMPLYIFGNDIKDFFNHLENSPSELPLMNIAFLGEEDDLDADARSRAFAQPGGGFLVFVSERRMGFGIHPNSGIAQELSEAIDHIFRRRMDEAEDAINEADPRPAMQQWLAERRKLESRVGGHQRRLYTSLTYIDDNICAIVGVEQAIRAIKLRRQIEQEAGLIMAIPEKRMLGTWGLWLGILLFSSLGMVVVPANKRVRASHAINLALNSQLAFDSYRSLMGLLEHVRHALCLPRKVMHGLYRPHGADGESRDGPSALVRPNYFMSAQLQQWSAILSSSAGSFFLVVLKRASLRPSHATLIYFGSSDAATDSSPPGIGGFMHGLYWYLALSAEVIRWLHISVLELLATAFSTIIFPAALPRHARLTLGADASATVTTLTRDTERSEMLMQAHHIINRVAEFVQASRLTDLGHLRGDANIASDLVSRAKWREFFRLCQHLRIRPVQLNVPPCCHRILADVLQAAILRNQPVRPNPYVSAAPAIPAHFLQHPSLASSASTRRKRARDPSQSRACMRCGEPLPLELFSLGRCPSCIARDGPPPSAPSSHLPGRRGLGLFAAASRATPAPSAAAVGREASSRKRTLSTRSGPERPASSAGLPDAVPVITIGGQRFAAPVNRTPQAQSPRKKAMLAYAHRRAQAMAPPSATPEQVAQLSAAVTATHELAEYGAAVGTLEKDDHAWEFWERFNAIYGWDAIIDPDFARCNPQEVSQRLAIFQAWVYPQLRGVNQPDAKPRTVFNNYVLAIIRTLAREHIPMPKAKQVERNLAGIMRAFKAVYGHEALMPGRKQPFTPAMWSKIEGLTEGQSLAGRTPWSLATNHIDRTVLRLGRVLWRTGHRLGEIVWHPSGEICYLTRKCVSISKSNGRKIAEPSSDDWHRLSAGDSVLLAPSTSKSDQFGEEHCPFPSILPYDGMPACAAAAVRDIELERPCAPQLRRTTPLFADAHGAPLRYAQLHSALRTLLSALFGKPFASAFSWHSIRIGLACALHAANAPDAVIQLICRWASADSLKVYRQMGIEKNVFWTNKAYSVTFDATRVNNLPALDGATYMLEQAAVFSPVEAPTPVARRNFNTFDIPGGTVQAFSSDSEGLVGLTVRVPRTFWSERDLLGYHDAAFTCTVAAECVRDFRHPDGTRARSYLLQWGSQFFPIKRESLLRACLSSEQRANLSA